MPDVIRAPRDDGDSIPNMATTTKKKRKGIVALDVNPFYGYVDGDILFLSSIRMNNV